MSGHEIRYLGDVQRLALTPGDVVVISVHGAITDDIAERLRKYVADVLAGHPVIVLADGIKVGVLSPQEGA